MDKIKDKKRIILHTVNYGDSKATSWLFKKYSQTVIKNMIINYGGYGELDKKSLNYWCLRLRIKPS